MRRGIKPNSKTQKARRTAKRIITQQHQPQILATEKYHKKDATKWSEDQDWEKLQDEFEKRNTSTGTFYYPSIRAFAQEKAHGHEDKERWMIKSIGPRPMKEIKWRGDWALERVFNISRETVELEVLEKKILEERDVLKLTIPVAASYAPWRSHLDTVRSKIVELLGGEIIEDKPKFKTQKDQIEWEKRQHSRLDWYQDQMERIFEFKAKLDTLYLKALGIDTLTKNNMVLEQAMTRILAAKGINQIPAQGQESTLSNEATIWMQAMTMEISKARAFDMPLPDDYKPVEKLLEKKKIIDVKAE